MHDAADGLLAEGPPSQGWHGERGTLRLNHDGQVSRRSATAAQIREAGLMLREELAVHRGLLPGIDRRLVSRLAAVPGDDPWYLR